MASTWDQRKITTFGILGSLGCLAGWVVGEGFLAVALPRIQQAQVAPSLTSSPKAIALAPVIQPLPPPPLQPAIPRNVVAAPPPALPVLRKASAPPPPAEFKERLDKFGAQTGDIQISLVWNNINDIDLHCIDPAGDEIYYVNKSVRSGGQLDVDKNANFPLIENPVENIFWPLGGAPEGRYRIYVNHYRNHGGTDPTAYKVSVLAGDKRQEFEGRISSGQPKRLIHEFTFGASLRLAVPERVALHAGNGNQVPVVISRQRYRGPVKVQFEGDLSGLQVAAVELAEGQNEATLMLNAESDAGIGPRELKLVARGGSAVVEEKILVQVESLPPVLQITVSPEVILIPGTSNTVAARIVRERFPGPLRLRCIGDLRGLNATEIELAEDQTEASLELTAEPTAVPGERALQLVAQGGALTSQANFIAQVEATPPVLHLAIPAEVILNPKTSNTVTVRIARERFHGPVELRLAGDMAGLVLPRIEIADGLDEGELLLTADERAVAGRHGLRLLASSGPFQAEGELNVVIPPKPNFPWLLALTIGVWTGLLATGVSLALVAGQTWYLSKRWPRWQQCLGLIGGGMIAGVVAGGFSQSLFSLLAQAEILPQLGFLIGWGLLGALLGRGVGFFIPNLHGGKAALAGAVGGLLGAAAFIGVSSVGDFAGRCIGAAILGGCLGLVVALVEAAFRDAWLEVMYGTKEMRTVNLGPEPIRIGADSSCTIWTPTDHPVVLRFWINKGRVTRQDVPADRTSEVEAGFREKVGRLEIIVRQGKSSTTTARTVTAPPPPPPPARQQQPAAPVSPPTPRAVLPEKANPTPSTGNLPLPKRPPPPPPPRPTNGPRPS